MSEKVIIGKLSEKEHFLRNVKFMLSLSAEDRLKYGKRKLTLPNFRSKKPRTFNTMKEYRKWLNTLPKWMGYGS